MPVSTDVTFDPSMYDMYQATGSIGSMATSLVFVVYAIVC